MIACPDCGTVQEVPALPRGAAALCPACGSRLERTTGRSVAAALSCAAATFALLLPANLLPLLRVTMLGTSRESHIWSSVTALWHGQWVIIAGLVAVLVVVLPLVRFGMLSAVLGCVWVGRRARWLGPAFRWSLHLDPWAMPDVFLIGCAVGYSRVASALPVAVGAGGGCFLAAALLCMLSRASLDRRTVWRAIGPEREVFDGPVVSCSACDLVVPAEAERSPCPRCGLTLRARKPDTIRRTVALATAGLVFYIPANVYPMSTALQMGREVPHRIVDGIRELVAAGLWPLAILITCTSILIPLLKLAGLGWFVVSARRRSSARLAAKTKLYRLIDEIGRWSNIDVFTVAVFVPLLQFRGIASTHAAPGASAFILVVLLTMLASRAFDPRVMWDSALGRTS